MLMKFEDALNNFKPKDESELLIGYDKTGEVFGHSFLENGSLIMAGATGSGMFVTINQMVVSGVFNADPKTLQFSFYDPKKMGYHKYSNSTHKVMTEPDGFKDYLIQLERLLDERIEMFANANVTDIKEYNEHAKDEGKDTMPIIITVADEIADYIFRFRNRGKGGDEYISRIAEKSRAYGIYFIICTQTPRREVLPGRLKATIPNRIALMLYNEMESQSLIGETGAESLKPHGDMIYVNEFKESKKSLQGTFVSEEQITTICDYAETKYSEVK